MRLERNSTADWPKQVTASTSSYLEFGLGDSSRACTEGVSAIVPPAGAQWTRTELNALTARIGYSSNVGSQPYWHGLLLQYFSR